ncbi:MAG: flagellar type III secretion system pore protein FliP [Armatimonadota bacterium]|jgi:flagellar biosynthetic protein FliP
MRSDRLTGAIAAVALLIAADPTAAQEPVVGLATGEGGDGGYIRLLLLFASVSLAPAILAVITSFARIIVVLLFLRAGIGAQEIPPTYVLIGLAILITIVAMLPTLQPLWDEAAGPLMAGEIDLPTAAERAEEPMRASLAGQVRPEDLALMVELSETDAPDAAFDAPLSVLAAAFAISELRAAFLIGFVIYLPFVIIDLVVGATLASVGMVSLPAPLLSLPFKILLFVMVDGWALLTEALMATIR